MQFLPPSNYAINNTATLPPNLPLLGVSPLLLADRSKPRTRTQIICAKWGRKRSGSRRSHRLIIKSIALIASNLRILPEPFDSFIKELAGGGNGGGFGFGAGGSGDGWGRRRRGNELGFWILFMAVSISALWVVLDRKGRGYLIWLFVFFAGFVLSCWIAKGWGREMKNWGLGFCCGALMVGLGLNRESLVRWIDRYRGRNSSPIQGLVKKMIRRRRRR